MLLRQPCVGDKEGVFKPALRKGNSVDSIVREVLRKGKSNDTNPQDKEKKSKQLEPCRSAPTIRERPWERVLPRNS